MSLLLEIETNGLMKTIL